MPARILLNGNCNAQYLGAALAALTDLDVKVAGIRFDGPIHFKGTLAPCEPLKSALTWFCQPGSQRILITLTTPISRYDLSDKLYAQGVDHHHVTFPFIRFSALDIREVEDGPAGTSSFPGAQDRPHLQ